MDLTMTWSYFDRWRGNLIHMLLKRQRLSWIDTCASSFCRVLHAFQKKATRGIATPKQELDPVRRRLRSAEQHYRDTRRGD